MKAFQPRKKHPGSRQPCRYHRKEGKEGNLLPREKYKAHASKKRKKKETLTCKRRKKPPQKKKKSTHPRTNALLSAFQ